MYIFIYKTCIYIYISRYMHGIFIYIYIHTYDIYITLILSPVTATVALVRQRGSGCADHRALPALSHRLGSEIMLGEKP